MVKQVLPKAGEAILALFNKLGGNMNNVLGSRSNITFLGKGKTPEGFIDSDINIEAIGVLGKNKILEELESSIGYLTAGKLNDVQANKLLSNMTKIDDVFNPKQISNITDLGTGTRNLDAEGIATLRRGGDPNLYKPGDAITSENFAASGFAPSDEVLKNLRKAREMADDLPPPGSRGGPDDIAAPFVSAEETIKNLRIQDPDLANQVRTMVDKGIISTVGNQGGNPAKRGAAREFLVEALKKDETDVGTAAFGKTNLNNVISAEDVRYITEGGGGIGGDPLVLVEKYFGPRIRDLVPEGASSEEILIFTNRVLNNVEDAAGLKPDNPRFDRFTARFVDEVEELNKGGRVGFQGGGMDASKDDFNTPGSGSYSRSYNPSAPGGVVQHGGGNPPSGGGGGDNDPPKRAVTFNTVVESQDIPVIDKSIPTVVGLEALLADKGKFKAVFDAEEAAKDLDLSSGAMLSYDGSIGPVNVNAMTNLSGDKNLNLGYQTKGGTNIGLETDMGDNAMFKISRTFAKGGLAKILEV